MKLQLAEEQEFSYKIFIQYALEYIHGYIHFRRMLL